MLNEIGKEDFGNNKERKKLKQCKAIIVNIRCFVERIRTKNPKLFDGLSTFLEIAWFLFGTFFSSLASNVWIAGGIASVAFGALYFYQWMILTNKLERELEEKEKEKKENIKRIKQRSEESIQEIRQKVMVSAAFSHNVTHDIKTQISWMPDQKIADTREKTANSLISILNDLEKILSVYYSHTICASIKLCLKANRLKTFARGNENIKCRGGRKKVQRLDKGSIRITDNYAYNSILKRQLSFFAEGDLKSLTEKENDSDVFYCEYGDKWPDYFLSTIVIPIRYRIVNNGKSEYKMLGVICVDSKEKHPEWSNRTDNYGYQMTAFVADAVYSLIDCYMIAQKESKEIANRE